MHFQMRVVIKFDRVPVKIRKFFRELRMSALEALERVFMAGTALLRSQKSRAHGWATMFPMAHDALRPLNLPVRGQVGIVGLKTGAAETMAIHTLG